MSIGKKLFFLIKVKSYFFVDRIKSIKFYKNFKFFLVDICLSIIYLFLNPYTIRRKFIEKTQNKKIFDYGETSLVEIDKLIKPLNLSKKDTILELGSGRGRVSFWLSLFYPAKVIAIEQVSSFTKIAQFLKKVFRLNNLKILNLDMFSSEFEKVLLNGVDYIYFYGTTLEDDKIKLLISKLKKIKRPIKIITISYSLSDYDKSAVLLKSESISFAWGKTQAYFCTIY